MPRDAVSRTANVERTGRHKWVQREPYLCAKTWCVVSDAPWSYAGFDYPGFEFDVNVFSIFALETYQYIYILKGKVQHKIKFVFYVLR